jgi:hypothetical protein
MFGLSIPELAKSGQFALLRAIWELGLGFAEDAPVVMQEALAQGHAHDAVVLVAGLVQASRRDDEAEISEAYRALVPDPFTRKDALRALGRHWAEQIAAASEEDVVLLLRMVESCCVALDYPGEPFTDFAHWSDLVEARDEIGYELADLIAGARGDARTYLATSQ